MDFGEGEHVGSPLQSKIIDGFWGGRTRRFAPTILMDFGEGEHVGSPLQSKIIDGFWGERTRRFALLGSSYR